MEDMTTAKLDARLRAQLTDPADRAVRLLVCSLSEFLCSDRLLRTLWLEARHAVLLSMEPSAWVTTRVSLPTAVLEMSLALFPAADINNSLTLNLDLFIHNCATETAQLTLLLGLDLLTCLAEMVRLHLAACAEDALTVLAADPVLGHVLACLSAHDLALVITSLIVDYSFGHFHLAATLAGN